MRDKRLWGAFTAFFAVLALYVFWGTWSPDVCAVMPDDAMFHPLSMRRQFRAWFSRWLENGKFVPSDFLWNGIVVSKYYLQEIKYVISTFCAALGLIYFLRGRGLRPIACFGAALMLAFCGYWFSLFSAGHGGWFVWMTYGVFAFGLVDRALAGGSFLHWVLLAACVAWGSFYQPDLWLLFTVFTGIYFLYRTVCASRHVPKDSSKSFWLSWTRGIVIAAVVFLAIAAPSVYDAFGASISGRNAQIKEAVDQAKSRTESPEAKASTADEKKLAEHARWIFVTNWSMPPEDTLEFFIPRVHGDTSCPMTLSLGARSGSGVKPYTGRLGRPEGAQRGNYRQHSLYVGFVTMLFALFAVCACWCGKAKGDVRFFALAALVFWLFSMGRFCEPVYRLVYHLPFGDFLRAPVKWHHLTEFCLCILAGFGIDRAWTWVDEKLPATKAKMARFALVALVIVGVCDLARIDKLFCAPIDMSIVRTRNAAAEDVIRRGKGTLADLVEGGNGLLSWSFSANDVGVTGDVTAKDVRFVLIALEQLKAHADLKTWLQSRGELVGYYRLTQKGVFGSGMQGANVVLFQMKDVPPPRAPTYPPVKPLVMTLALFSFAATLGVVAFVLVTFARRRKALGVQGV